MVDPLPLPQIGRAIGFHVSFPTLPNLSFDHGSHYAQIDASLPGGLEAGSYRIEIERMTNADFGTLAQAWVPDGESQERSLLKLELRLMWRDRAGSTPLSTLPLTAVLAVTNLSRVIEGTRIKTVIEGREWIFEQLSRRSVRSGFCPDGFSGAISHLLGSDGGLSSSDYTYYPPSDSAPAEPPNFEGGSGVIESLERVANALAQKTRRSGRGVFLIRDGKLYVGTARPIPFAGARPYPLSPGTGLIRSEFQGQQRPTAEERARAAETNTTVRVRDTYLLTLTGRPDLKPGDVVTASVDTAARGLSGGFGVPTIAGMTTSSDVTLYISGVHHRLGKNHGWETTATGVTIDLEPVDGGTWDVPAPAQQGHGRAGSSDPESPDPTTALARQIREEARRAVVSQARPRVGEVRGNHVTTDMNGAVVSHAAQSVDMFIGLEMPDGLSRRSRRQEVRRSDPANANVPCLSPFAWGPYGLVLPHYPGERVLVLHHENDSEDPVVLGSLWRTNDSSNDAAPQNVQAGDWWLILPAGVQSSARSSASGTGPVALPSNAKAVHDLIDADGARVIQMKELTIRTFPDQNLGTPQTRPQASGNGGILITHDNGAKIEIASDGSITIESNGTLKLKAGGGHDVEIEGQNIKLKGQAVDVVS